MSAPLKLSFIPPTRSRDVITLWWGCRSWLSHLRVQIEETDGVKGKFLLVPNLHSFEVNWGLTHIRSLYLCSLIHTKHWTPVIQCDSFLHMKFPSWGTISQHILLSRLKTYTQKYPFLWVSDNKTWWFNQWKGRKDRKEQKPQFKKKGTNDAGLERKMMKLHVKFQCSVCLLQPYNQSI